MTIKSINIQFGESFEFSTVDEMIRSIGICGYELPEDGLVEGRDYEMVENSTATLMNINASSQALYNEALKPQVENQRVSPKNKLHSREKEFLRDMIAQACMGTPLQPNAEFAGGYLGNLIASYMENWEVIQRELGIPSSNLRDKVVINRCYGGFGLSQEAFEAYHNLRELPLPKDRYEAGDAIYYWAKGLDRDDPYLVQVVETLGDKANGPNAGLRVQVVGEQQWRIRNHHGLEKLILLGDHRE